MANQSALQPTSASDWVKESIQVVELPSGKAAELKQPDVVSLLFEGDELPDFIAQPIMQSMGLAEGANVTDAPAPQFMSKKDLSTLLRWASDVTVAVMVSPKCLPEGGSPNYSGGEISIKDVSFEDRMFIFEWVMEASGLTEAAANFREK